MDMFYSQSKCKRAETFTLYAASKYYTEPEYKLRLHRCNVSWWMQQGKKRAGHIIIQTATQHDAFRDLNGHND